MKIGVFDSGLGGLVIAKAFTTLLPEYDYLYYGDTKNLPYGDKSPKQIMQHTINAVEHLIHQNCKIIILACNTATSIALRYIQQVFIPNNYPDIKVLGVIIPTLEETISKQGKNIGVIATPATIDSHIYSIELTKLNKNLKIQEISAPELVPAIENNNFDLAKKIVKDYHKKFNNIDSLILGCTHYPLIRDVFQQEFKNTNIIASNGFMGTKLQSYLANHPEIESKLSKTNSFEVTVSLTNPHYENVAKQIFSDIKITCLSKSQ